MTDITEPPKKGSAGNVTAADGHTYHKSASAGATEAPTSGQTQSAAEMVQSLPLTELELDFVTLVDMHWGTRSELLTAPVGYQMYGIEEDEFNRCFNSPAVRAALLERGIDLRPKTVMLDPTDPEVKPSWRESVLTPQQLIVANFMLNYLDTRSDRKKLQDLGVSPTTYQAWLRNPDFQRYLQERSESMVQGFLHEAHMALMDKVRSGDLKAIAYLHEYTGKFSLRPNADGTSGAITAESVRQLVSSIIEIVVEEVSDADTGTRIGERIRGLITARSVANELVGTLNGEGPTEITQPEIMPGRVITPDIEALMQKGVGVE